MEETASQELGRRRSLAGLLEELDPLDLRVVAAPAGLEVPVGQPVLFDPLEETGPQDGEMVLGVGLDPGGASFRRVLREMAASGAAVVVCKFLEEPAPELIRLADELGIVLLAAPTRLSWGQLFTLVRTAISATAVGGEPGEMSPIGDLFALANAVAAMVGAATTIEDPRSQVLAYSSLGHATDTPRREAILGRQVPTEWMRRLEEAGTFRRLWQGDEPVDIPAAPELGMRRRLAVAVRAAGEIIGSIWVVEGDTPLGPDAIAGLREAAQMAAIHLLRRRGSEDLERRRRADALTSLLNGGVGVRQPAQVLGLEVATSVVVVALAQAASSDPDVAMRAQRAADLVALYFESYSRQASCAAVGGTVYALLPGSGPGGSDRRKELVATAVKRVGESLHIRLVGGIGRPVPGLNHVAQSRRQADQAAQALLAEPRGRLVAEIDDVSTKVVLAELAEIAHSHPELMEGRLAGLARHDEAKRTSYVPTLRAYLDAFGDVAAAAEALNVHPNTLRYRLRRVSEICDLDLGDADDRLVAELQLRFLS